MADSLGVRCLLSLQDTQALFSPLGRSARIKYTCISASQHYVALGANTGSVYCFHRDGLRYIRIISNKEGGISLVRFSPAENHLAVVSGGGYVAFWELNLQEHGVSKRFHVSSLLKDAAIRSMVWDSRASRLFYGDDQGRVAIAYMPKLSTKFASGSLFKRQDEIIFNDRSPIVQLDYYQEKLLVSTHTRCVLIKLGSRDAAAVQVGKKPRDGPFGACFHVRRRESMRERPPVPVVYSARPGGRLWEADVNGTVVSTLKLKDFVSIPFQPILGVGFTPDFSAASSTLTQTLNFPALSIHQNKYMVAWLTGVLFLFDPAAYKLAAWTCTLEDITDVCCDRGRLLVLCEGGNKVAEMTFDPLESCLRELVQYGELEQATLLLSAHSSKMAEILPQVQSLHHPLKTILEFARSLNDNTLPENLQTVQSVLEESIKEEVISMEMNSDGRPQDTGTKTVMEWETNENESEDGMVKVNLDSYPSAVEGEVENQPCDFTTESARKDLVAEDTESDLEMSTEKEEAPSEGIAHPQVAVNQCNSVAHDEHYPTHDTLSLEMEMAFEDTDFDHQTKSTADHPDQADHIDTDPIKENQGRAETGTNSTTEEQLADTVRRHSKSHSWGGNELQEGNQNPKSETNEGSDSNLKHQLEASLSTSEKSLELSGGHSQESTPLHAYPETEGVEIPKPPSRTSSRGAEILDPFMKTALHSGPSSLDTTSGGSEAEFPTALRKPLLPEARPMFTRSQSLSVKTVAARLVPVLKQSTSDDDIIAVPVRSSSVSSSKESGGRTRGKRKLSKKKKPGSSLARRMSNPENSVPADILSRGGQPEPPSSSHPHTRSTANLLNIPEETLPFPEVGLPSTFLSHPPSLPPHPTTSRGATAHISSSPRTDSLLTNLNPSGLLSKMKSITQKPAERFEPQSHPPQKAEKFEKLPPQRIEREKYSQGGERPSERSVQEWEQEAPIAGKTTAFISKMKSIAKQGGQNIGIEPEAIQRPMKIMKELLSSLANPQPSSSPSTPPQGAYYSGNYLNSQLVYRNEDFMFPREPNRSGFNQSKVPTASVSMETEAKQPLIPQDPKVLALTSVTMDTMHSLEDPHIICSPDKMREKLRAWLRVLEQAITQTTISIATKQNELAGGDSKYFDNQRSQGQEARTGGEDRLHGSEKEREGSVGGATTSGELAPTVAENSQATTEQSGVSPDRHRSTSPPQEKDLEEARTAGGSDPQKSQNYSGAVEISTEPLHPGDTTPQTPINTITLLASLEESTRHTVMELVTLCTELGVYSSTEDTLQAMVGRFGSVLNFGRVRELLGGKDWTTQCVCWRTLAQHSATNTTPSVNTVLELASTDTSAAVDYVSKNIATLSHCLPACLLRLYEEKRYQALVEICSSCCPHIMPWEVAVVCFSTESQDDHMHQHGMALYAQYLNRILENGNMEFLVSDQLLLMSLESVLHFGPNKDQVIAPNGHPRAWSHMTKWEHQACLEWLVEMAVAMETEQREAANSLCEKHGYWVGVVRVSVAMGNTRRALHTLLCLRDLRLFTEKQEWGPVLKTINNWKLLLELMAELKLPATPTEPPTSPLTSPPHTSTATPTTEISSATNTGRNPPRHTQPSSKPLQSSKDPAQGPSYRVSLPYAQARALESFERRERVRGFANSSRMGLRVGVGSDCVEVTWLGVLRLMLGSLGPLLVRELLSGVDLDHIHGNHMQEQLHFLLVQLSSIHTQQRVIAHSLLEKVDRYLWSPQPNALSPQLLAVQRREQEVGRDSESHDLMAEEALFSSGSVFPRSLEDASSHWGVKVKRSTRSAAAVCVVCRLPLLRAVSDLQSGVTAFHCGHSFHKQCLPEQACVICFSENFQKYQKT